LFDPKKDKYRDARRKKLTDRDCSDCRIKAQAEREAAEMEGETPSRPADVDAVRRRMLTDMLAGVKGDDVKAVIATGDMDAIRTKIIEKAKEGDVAVARW
jgi:hypothetical protein